MISGVEIAVKQGIEELIILMKHYYVPCLLKIQQHGEESTAVVLADCQITDVLRILILNCEIIHRSEGEKEELSRREIEGNIFVGIRLQKYAKDYIIMYIN